MTLPDCNTGLNTIGTVSFGVARSGPS